MVPDSRYIPAFSINEVILDKDTGQPLSGGQVTFYSDSQRATLKPVYQLTGYPNYSFIELPNPMTLNAGGAFEDALQNPVVPYFFPFDDDGNIELYYVEVDSAGGTNQFTREAVPYLSAGIDPSGASLGFENALENPQFVQTYLNAGQAQTFSVTGAVNEAINFAPGWDLVLNGTGSVTVTWTAISGTMPITNPPYVIDITSAGLTNPIQLRQRLQGSPSIFSGGAVAGYLICQSQDGAEHTISMRYIQSTGTPTVVTVFSENVPNDGLYNALYGTAAVATGNNPQSAPVAYVDIIIEIPVGAHVRLSSIQLIGLADDATTVSVFDEQPAARQIDHTFNTYFESITLQPKNSILTGWDFPLNPWQFAPTASTTLTSTQYVADQTIIACENNNTLEFSRTTEGYLSIEALSASTQGKFAVVQYIDYRTALAYFGGYLSCAMNAAFVSSNSTALGLKACLLYSTSVPAAVNPVLSWNAAGTDPTFTAQWTVVKPAIDTVDIMTTDGVFNTSTYDKFLMPAVPGATPYLALVLYSDGVMSSAGTPDIVYFDKVSLIPNEFALDATPMTFDQTLRQCQFYYEKTYPVGVRPGTALGNIFDNAKVSRQDLANSSGGSTPSVLPREFSGDYATKRTDSPLLQFFSPLSGAANQVAVSMYLAGAPIGSSASVSVGSFWSQLSVSQNGFIYNNTTSSAIYSPGVITAADNGIIYYHYVVDARL